jgi:hypothetical protein
VHLKPSAKLILNSKLRNIHTAHGKTVKGASGDFPIWAWKCYEIRN